MSKNESGFMDPDAIYFTTRRLSTGKWVAESLQLIGDKVIRNHVSEPGGRAHALEQFRIAVAKYWRHQYKNL